MKHQYIWYADRLRNIHIGEKRQDFLSAASIIGFFHLLVSCIIQGARITRPGSSGMSAKANSGPPNNASGKSRRGETAETAGSDKNLWILAMKNLASKFNFEVLNKKTIEVLKKSPKTRVPKPPCESLHGPKNRGITIPPKTTTSWAATARATPMPCLKSALLMTSSFFSTPFSDSQCGCPLKDKKK